MSNKRKGILFIISAAFWFSLMTVFIRLSGDLPTMQKSIFRNAVAAMIAIGIIARSEIKVEFNRSQLKDLLLRSFFGTVGIIANFYAVDNMNIADANMLNKLSPFFAIIASAIILKEKASRIEFLTVIVAFTGALFVIKPGFQVNNFPAIVGVIGGLTAGIAYTYVRKLGKTGLPGPIIVMFFSVFSTISVLPFAVAQYEPMSLRQVVALLLAGVCAAGGQLSITKAYTYAPAKDISVFDYSQIIFASIWGFVFFSQLPDIWSLIGYIIIIGAAITKFAAARKASSSQP